MPNRFQVNQHDLAYNFLAAYEGEYCLVGRISQKSVQVTYRLTMLTMTPGIGSQVTYIWCAKSIILISEN